MQNCCESLTNHFVVDVTLWNNGALSHKFWKAKIILFILFGHSLAFVKWHWWVHNNYYYASWRQINSSQNFIMLEVPHFFTYKPILAISWDCKSSRPSNRLVLSKRKVKPLNSEVVFESQIPGYKPNPVSHEKSLRKILKKSLGL